MVTKNGTIFDGSMRITDIWARNVIFLHTSVFIHPHEYSKTEFSKMSSVFEDAFSVTIFNGYMWKVGQTDKKSPFSNQNWYLWTGPKSSLRSRYLGRYPILLSRESVARRQPTYQHTCSSHSS